MTFSVMADRVIRITKQLKAEALHYLYEAQTDFIQRTNCMQKIKYWPITPATGTITTIETDSGYAKYTTSAAHSLAVNDWVAIWDTSGYNGIQQVTAVADTTHFTTDRAYSADESGLTATFRYGFQFDLPDDYVDFTRIDWEGQRLDQYNLFDYETLAETDGFELKTQGDPSGFWMEADIIRLLPAPTDTSSLTMRYVYYDTTSAPTSPIIPSKYHQYLVDYAIATQLESQDLKGSDDRVRFYWEKYGTNADMVSANYAMRAIST